MFSTTSTDIRRDDTPRQRRNRQCANRAGRCPSSWFTGVCGRPGRHAYDGYEQDDANDARHDDVGPLWMSMMPFEHIEGRIAFLKAELAITDTQLPQWNAFADALRAGAKGMQETMSKMMQAGMPATAAARADPMVQMVTTRLDGMK